jgi:iron complex outermembrane receptor protein
MGVKREFFNQKLLLQITANDLFNTGSVYFYESDYGGMIVDGDIAFDGRRSGVSATYKFGNQKSRRGKSAIDDELRRISD